MNVIVGPEIWIPRVRGSFHSERVNFQEIHDLSSCQNVLQWLVCLILVATNVPSLVPSVSVYQALSWQI